MIYPGGAGSFKMILILLAKVIAFYVRFIPIGFQVPSFNKMLLRLIAILSKLYKCIHKFCEKFVKKEKNMK